MVLLFCLFFLSDMHCEKQNSLMFEVHQAGTPHELAAETELLIYFWNRALEFVQLLHCNSEDL